MRKIIEILYILLIPIIIIFLIVSSRILKNDVFYGRDHLDTYHEYNGFHDSWVSDQSLPLNGMDVLYINSLKVDSNSASLIFYEHHQCVNVYIDDVLIYSLKPSSDNLFGKTPGNNWIVVPVYKSDTGKAVKIELIPVYQSSVHDIPKVYIGSKSAFFVDKINYNIFTYALAIITIFIGFIFVLWALYLRSLGELSGSLMSLGSFAVLVGIWKIYDVNSVEIFNAYEISACLVTHLCLMMLISPFILYLSSMFKWVNLKLNYIVCLISIIFTYIAIGFQIFNIFDLRSLLIAVHSFMGVIVILGFFYMIREIITQGFTYSVKVTLVCVVSCFIGTLIDMFIFYTGSDNYMTDFGIIGLLIYIGILGFKTLKESFALIRKGRIAKSYQQMAFTDELTGLLSRIAYKEYLTSPEFNLDKMAVIMCDLNNLKTCNDKFGHEMGDAYIKNASNFISETFSRYGSSYRIGGDEFCVLLPGCDDDLCLNLIEELQNTCMTYNNNNKDAFPIYIACGHAIFDKNQDYDFSDTLRRADEQMYHNKDVLKKNIH